MKYLVILFVSFNNGDADKKAIYEALDENDAIALFHTNLGNYMKNENVSEVLCMAINSVGGIYKNECWMRPAKPEPEPEPEIAENEVIDLEDAATAQNDDALSDSEAELF